MLTIDEVQAQIDRMEHGVDGITFRWNVSYAYASDSRWPLSGSPSHVGFFIQMEYDEVDLDDPSGPTQVQRTERWLISKEARPSEVFQRCLRVALASAEHRVREHFLVDGVRIYGPHLDADELVALLKVSDGAV